MRRISWTGRGSQRPLRLVGVFVAAGVLATACSGGGSTSSARHSAKTTTTTSSTPTTPTSSTPGVSNPCSTSQLTASETSGGVTKGGGGIGVGAVFSLTNKSTQGCALAGYPSLEVLGTKNAKLVTTVVQGGGAVPATLAANPVNLAPGAQASFMAAWVTANATQNCPHGFSVRITPPGSKGVLTVSADITACNNGTINVSPVQPNVIRLP